MKHLESLERTVLSERQIAAVLLAAGAKDVEMPTLAQCRLEFDAALSASLTVVETPHSALARALGVAS